VCNQVVGSYRCPPTVFVSVDAGTRRFEDEETAQSKQEDRSRHDDVT